ncbi:aminopeptidase N [Glaciibacter flavus]|uniref:Aminopeptidase N n=1 Tax=Orlajensenia flava TaxID=2565934 RepID=A0A4S4FXK7_9MICO|nr:aminopeptidase N [Glaciibacter flavus]THG35041.1 aminopeptidase N [Glaciibacter flavus]
MPAANLTRVEAERRASLVRVHDYDVELDLTTGPDTFASRTVVRFSASAGADAFVELNAEALRSAVLNGRPLEPSEVFDGSRIRLADLGDENELIVESTQCYTNTGEGLHRFVDPVDGAVYLYTEFAVAEANRVFAVFDQPDLKAAFRFTVTAPSGWQVLSNAPTPAPESLGESERWSFASGPVMSTYVAAIIAGPYRRWEGSATTTDGRTIPLGLFTRASFAEHAEPEVMFATVDAGIRFYEAAYGVPFPYEKYDQIFVPEYNWGAMENIGAVTFNESYLFRSRVSEARLQQRSIVILHELSHMWFGNLVTMKWWNDLWLNESFATWTSMAATAAVTPFTDAWATFTSVEKTDAAAQDQLPSTHPIVARIDDLEDVEVNFDGITYDKGASVIKQLVAWVGIDAFHAGVGAYLRAHANGNATLRDLLDELETSSGRELTEWSRLWLETAGVNTLRVRMETDAERVITAFVVEQSASVEQPTLRPHRVAIGFYDDGDDGIRRVHRVELDIDGAETAVPELVGPNRPDLVLLNDDDLTYAQIRLDDASLAVALDGLGDIRDPVARALIWGSVWDAVRDGEVAASQYVHLVLGNVARETESTARSTALAQLELAVERYLSPAHAELVAAEAGDALWALCELATASSDEQLQFVRSFARVARTGGQLDIVAGLCDGSVALDGLAVDTELRWELTIALSAGGRASVDDIAAVLAGDDTATGRLRAATAEAARPDAAIKEEAWDRVATDASLSNDLARAIASGWAMAHPVDLLAGSVEPYFAMLQSTWAQRSFSMAALIVKRLFPASLVTPETASAARAWLAGNETPAPLRRLVAEQLAELERALGAQSRDAQTPAESAA